MHDFQVQVMSSQLHTDLREINKYILKALTYNSSKTYFCVNNLFSYFIQVTYVQDRHVKHVIYFLYFVFMIGTFCVFQIYLSIAAGLPAILIHQRL